MPLSRLHCNALPTCRGENDIHQSFLGGGRNRFPDTPVGCTGRAGSTRLSENLLDSSGPAPTYRHPQSSIPPGPMNARTRRPFLLSDEARSDLLLALLQLAFTLLGIVLLTTGLPT